MARILVFVLSLTVFSAHAIDLEKWVDKMIDKDTANYRKEQITILSKEPDPEYRIKAAEWLSSQRDPESVAALAGALSDKDARVRKAAASSLWDHAEKGIAAKPQLLKALDDPDANVVAYAAGALQAMGLKEAELAAPRKRVVASQDASVNARFLAARNLVGYETPTVIVVPMIAYLERNTQNRTNLELVENALEHLVKKTKDRSLVRPLYEALGNTKNGQIPLLKALGFFEPKPEGWTEVLVGQLDHPQPRVRSAALGQLRSVKKEKDVATWLPRVTQMLQDSDPSVRSDALWTLGSAKGLAAGEVDKVVAALGDKEKSVRRSAARALEEIGEANQAIPAAARAKIESAARPALTAALEDPDSDVRDAAKSALRNMGKGGGGTAVASAATGAPASAGVTKGGNEAAGLAVLRERKVKYEPTQFFRALTETDVDLVRAFLDAGMSPNQSLSELGPPIRVMLFASNACSPNVRPTKPATKEIIQMLLDRGADVNLGDQNKNTAITEAASKGCDREVIRMLIKAGAKINVPNGSGLTPFEMGLWGAGDGLDELIAAGYRLPPDKAKMYLDGYKDRPASIAMVKKATKK